MVIFNIFFSFAYKLTRLEEQGDLVLAGERTIASVNISDWLDRKLRNADSVPLIETNKQDPRRLSEYDICPSVIYARFEMLE